MIEAAAYAKEVKEVSTVREAFIKEVGLSLWDEALEVLPQYTSQLTKFRGSNMKEPAFKV